MRLEEVVMKYGKIVEGKFIDRPNRFIAHVEMQGRPETVHVKKYGDWLAIPHSGGGGPGGVGAKSFR